MIAKEKPEISAEQIELRERLQKLLPVLAMSKTEIAEGITISRQTMHDFLNDNRSIDLKRMSLIRRFVEREEAKRAGQKGI